MPRKNDDKSKPKWLVDILTECFGDQFHVGISDGMANSNIKNIALFLMFAYKEVNNDKWVLEKRNKEGKI